MVGLIDKSKIRQIYYFRKKEGPISQKLFSEAVVGGFRTLLLIDRDGIFDGRSCVPVTRKFLTY